MPTSSQALLLHKSAAEMQYGKTRARSSCVFRRPAACSVATVYKLKGCMPDETSNSCTPNPTSVMNRDYLHLLKTKSLPQAFRGGSPIHSSDERLTNPTNTPTGSSCCACDYELADEMTHHIPAATASRVSSCQGSDSRESLRTYRQPSRATPETPKRSTSGQMRVNPFVYEKLVNLGFRSSALKLERDCVYDAFSGRKTPYPEHPDKTRIDNKVHQHNKDTLKHVTIGATESETSAPLSVARNSSTEVSESESDSETESVDVTTGLRRIKPSMHMRKDIPEPRPRAAIFSFRDNEYSSHAEVKYLIETQIGARVKCVQFDPLDIRLVKPGVHSRWIVEFHSQSDLEKSVQKGLVYGKDKLIFYRHDDIASREVNSFKYYKTIQDAKKKLKGNKTALRKAKSGKQSLSESAPTPRQTKSTNATPITKYE